MSRNRDVYDRDWERGKPEWEEDPGWSGSGNRSQWRGDEAYGGGKGYYPPPEDYYHDMDSRPTWSEPGDPEGDWKRRRISHDEVSYSCMDLLSVTHQFGLVSRRATSAFVLR
jgi:hypothetical protein